MRNRWRDLVFGFRLLLKNPGFTAVAVLALALGIGANTAIFSVVYATLLAPLPYHEPDRIVMVWSQVNGNRNGVSAGDFLDWQRQNTTFESIAAWTGRSLSLSTGSQPERIQASACTPQFLHVLGQPFLLGRDFLPEEGQVGKDLEAVLSYRLWQDRFGGDKNIVGQQIRLERPAIHRRRRSRSRRHRPIANSDVRPARFQAGADQSRISTSSLIMARMKAGVTLAQANADMQSVTAHIATGISEIQSGLERHCRTAAKRFSRSQREAALWMMLGAVGFVLLIACANVANLLLARGTARQSEIAVRAALGATRGQLFGQFLTESLALAAIGGALGIGLAWALLKMILALMPQYTLPSEADVTLNIPVLLFTMAATMLAGVLFGCVPAFQAARLNLNDTLKEGGRSGGAGKHRVRHALVLAEFALALTLLAAAGLAVHSFWNLTHVDMGFPHRPHPHVSVCRCPPNDSKPPAQITAFYRELNDASAGAAGNHSGVGIDRFPGARHQASACHSRSRASRLPIARNARYRLQHGHARTTSQHSAFASLAAARSPKPTLPAVCRSRSSIRRW